MNPCQIPRESFSPDTLFWVITGFMDCEKCQEYQRCGSSISERTDNGDPCPKQISICSFLCYGLIDDPGIPD
jgi:hypothetical protein